MENNIILNCGDGLNVTQGGEIFAMKNSLTCQRGFIAGGMLRGYFKDNYLDCQLKMCVSDVPPSFVIDSNDEKTITQF